MKTASKSNYIKPNKIDVVKSLSSEKANRGTAVYQKIKIKSKHYSKNMIQNRMGRCVTEEGTFDQMKYLKGVD